MSCYGCTKQYLGCHSKCEDYLAFKKDLEEQKAARNKARAADNMFRSVSISSYKRITKSR